MKSKLFKILFINRSNDKRKILNIQENAFKILEQMEEKPEELLLEKIGIKNNSKLSKKYNSGYLTFMENEEILIIDNIKYNNITKNDIKDFAFFNVERFYKFKKIVNILENIFIGIGIIGPIFVPNMTWKLILSSVGSFLFLLSIIIDIRFLIKR